MSDPCVHPPRRIHVYGQGEPPPYSKCLDCGRVLRYGRRVIVTGSRDWTDREVVRHALADLPSDTLIIEGGHRPKPYDPGKSLDNIARQEARRRGLAVETVEADWVRYGKAAGPRRNQVMVDAGAELVLAFPLPQSRGTRDCMRRAEAAGIPVVEVSQGGTVSTPLPI